MRAIAGAFPLASGVLLWYTGRADQQPTGCTVVTAQRLGGQAGCWAGAVASSAILLSYLQAKDNLGRCLTWSVCAPATLGVHNTMHRCAGAGVSRGEGHLELWACLVRLWGVSCRLFTLARVDDAVADSAW